ncbi:oxidoreductase [Gloeophyllum trabeum ATCC 11539]|uniref:Oxidoreductase n=1 Tax=Gloeophyllum trabeum (strain ATCC 11539 / FP-39264 / Madison 617) TaxID=670483 RepID=S7RC16_GLOTA|nr:oxidoreductase [Gloeophyllum trabeum ATCC 11539]EPQ51785.1 oxidoreductase [Gloeophyllum trabeum ATCC 11539]
MSSSKPLGGRTAIVGTGSRAAMFVRGIVARPKSSVVAICEPNAVRASYYNDLLTSLGAPTVPVYKPDQFKEMLEKENVETVVITCVDALHDLYIVPALEAGVRVLTEKPMTTDVAKCRRILETVNRTGRHLTVTFNYRYNPVHELVKRTIAAGEIGEVLSVHFEWLLDTVHGADYFRRWHRQKSNSGGLMVHKSGHHFDLVNWWIDAEPETVAGMGRLAFYGEEAGKKHGWARSYERARGSAEAKNDPFAIDLEGDETLKKIYADAEGEDGYYRDQNVFAPGIGIEDDMSLLVRYNTGAVMTYHLTAYSPWEGYRVMFNGSQGRLELEVVESAYRLAEDPQLTGGQIHGKAALPNAGGATVKLHKLWQKPVLLPVQVEHGEHGGGDRRMLSVLFGPQPGEEVDTGDASKQGANERDGAMALAVGLMANESFRTNQFVHIKSLALPL